MVEACSEVVSEVVERKLKSADATAPSLHKNLVYRQRAKCKRRRTSYLPCYARRRLARRVWSWTWTVTVHHRPRPRPRQSPHRRQLVHRDKMPADKGWDRSRGCCGIHHDTTRFVLVVPRRLELPPSASAPRPREETASAVVGSRHVCVHARRDFADVGRWTLNVAGRGAYRRTSSMQHRSADTFLPRCSSASLSGRRGTHSRCWWNLQGGDGRSRTFTAF